MTDEELLVITLLPGCTPKLVQKRKETTKYIDVDQQLGPWGQEEKKYLHFYCGGHAFLVFNKLNNNWLSNKILNYSNQTS